MKTSWSLLTSLIPVVSVPVPVSAGVCSQSDAQSGVVLWKGGAKSDTRLAVVIDVRDERRIGNTARLSEGTRHGW